MPREFVCVSFQGPIDVLLTRHDELMIVHSLGSVAVALDNTFTAPGSVSSIDAGIRRKRYPRDSRIRACGSVLGREDKAERPGTRGRLNITLKGT